MKWTHEADAILCQMFGEGKTDREMAMHFDCGTTAIEIRRRRLRLLRPSSIRSMTPGAPRDRYPSGPAIDAMFRAAEKPAGYARPFRGWRPPSLISRGEAMT